MDIKRGMEEVLTQLNSLISYVEELKEEINTLESKNEKLRTYLVTDKTTKGAGNLMKLYEQGFHICHETFGKLREDECLFCLSVIERTE